VRDVEVQKDLRPLPQVIVDREQIKSVITNLLLNARDALGAAGRIEVRTSQEDGRAVLTVSDNGAGMSAEFVRNSLFRPFQSTKKKGLGIGMFQSRTVIEAHRGSIQVESQLGKGNTFRIYFSGKPAGMMKPKLLIVDDDEEIRTQMKRGRSARITDPACRGSGRGAGGVHIGHPG
jgi:signal transduction histidine kinase